MFFLNDAVTNEMLNTVINYTIKAWGMYIRILRIPEGPVDVKAAMYLCTAPS